MYLDTFIVLTLINNYKFNKLKIPVLHKSKKYI